MKERFPHAKQGSLFVPVGNTRFPLDTPRRWYFTWNLEFTKVFRFTSLFGGFTEDERPLFGYKVFSWFDIFIFDLKDLFN